MGHLMGFELVAWRTLHAFHAQRAPLHPSTGRRGAPDIAGTTLVVYEVCSHRFPSLVVDSTSTRD